MSSERAGNSVAVAMERFWREHGGRHDHPEWQAYVRDYGELIAAKLVEMGEEHDNLGRFGMSKAGGCIRAAALKLAGHDGEELPGSTRATFAIGHVLEIMAIATLRACGYVVTGMQSRVTIDPMMASTVDGYIAKIGVPGEMVLSVKTMGFKMALATTTLIPTPDGWRIMGDLKEGDRVFDENGLPVVVEYASPVYRDNDCYRITFDDGATIVADGDHLWLVETALDRSYNSQRGEVVRPPRTVTTREMLTSGVRQNTRRNYRMPVARPADYSDSDLPVDPYVLGAWLGDGASGESVMAAGDAEVLDGFATAGIPYKHVTGVAYRVGRPGTCRSNPNSFMESLRKIGVARNKHIPTRYLTASYRQRLSLLRGLMDTDGHARTNGGCVFTNTNYRLVLDVVELLSSLGIKASIATHEAKIADKSYGPAYNVHFSAPFRVFTVARKSVRQKLARHAKSSHRYVDAIARVDSVPVRCIRVNSDSGLFLAGRNYIVTHNSGKRYGKGGVTWTRHGFAAVAANGVKAEQPGHWAQMQAEMHASGCARALYVVIAKDMIKAMEADPVMIANGSLTFYAEIVDYDEAFVTRSLLPEWESAWSLHGEGTLPSGRYLAAKHGYYVQIHPRTPEANKELTGTFDPCSYCDMRAACLAAYGYDSSLETQLAASIAAKENPDE